MTLEKTGRHLGQIVHGHGGSKGKKGTREYRAWESMKYRCLVPTCKEYCYYGARGIEIYDIWKTNYSAFFAYLGSCPADHYLERIDVNGDYVPGNVKWATRIEQANNKRNVKKYTYQGRTMTATQWDRELGYRVGTIRQRVKRFGWTIKEAITRPVINGGYRPKK